MRRVQYHQYGGPDTMCLETFTLPQPAQGEVAVRVIAAAINPIDWKIRGGDLKMMTGRRFPRAMGCDFAGVVTAIGPAVTKFKPGDAVFGITSLKPSGAFAEAVINPEAQLAIKPDAISFAQAAAMATPAVMAISGLVDIAHVGPGSSVFVNGCTGGVGEAVVQVAHMLGAQVTGSCSKRNMTRARDLGVDTVYDYAATTGPDQYRANGPYDVVYDVSGSLPVKLAMALTKRGGRLLDINASPAKFVHATYRRRHKLLFCKPTNDILTRAAHAAATGNLTMTIGHTADLHDAPSLIAKVETGSTGVGKALIIVDPAA